MKWISSIKMILTLRCDQSAQLLSLQQETKLTLVQKTALSMHLLLCRACRRYKRQLRFLRTCYTHFREKIGTSQMSPQSKEKIRRRLEDSSEE